MGESPAFLDVASANREVLRWLDEIANARTHGTTGIAPRVRLIEDRAHLSALPLHASLPAPAPSRAAVVPIESLQHPLAVYDALLESAA